MRPPTAGRFPALTHTTLPALVLTALLSAACVVQTGRPACGPRRLEVANLGARPVEQLYYGAPGAWGEDLLLGVEVPPEGARSVVLPGVAGLTLRIVWADGHAIELNGLDPCRNARVVIAESSIRAD